MSDAKIGILLAVAILGAVILIRVLVWASDRKKGHQAVPPKSRRLPGIYDSSSFRLTGQYRDSGLPEIEPIDDKKP
jgi:hypothetical protein